MALDGYRFDVLAVSLTRVEDLGAVRSMGSSLSLVIGIWLWRCARGSFLLLAFVFDNAAYTARLHSASYRLLATYR